MNGRGSTGNHGALARWAGYGTVRAGCFSLKGRHSLGHAVGKDELLT